MPFTPFHLGPSSWIGLLLLKIFDFPALILSSIIVDVEPFLIIVFNLDYPLHGFFHSFLGGFIMAVVCALIIYSLKDWTKKITLFLKISQESSFKKILWTSFFGVYLHVLMDSFLYKEMNPLFPLKGNPFLGIFSSQQVYFFCVGSFLIGTVLYYIMFLKKKNI